MLHYGGSVQTLEDLPSDVGRIDVLSHIDAEVSNSSLEDILIRLELEVRYDFFKGTLCIGACLTITLISEGLVSVGDPCEDCLVFALILLQLRVLVHCHGPLGQLVSKVVVLGGNI